MSRGVMWKVVMERRDGLNALEHYTTTNLPIMNPELTQGAARGGYVIMTLTGRLPSDVSLFSVYLKCSSAKRE